MSKTIFTITLPNEDHVRKKQPKPTAVMRDRTKYTRKQKHKGRDYDPGLSFLANQKCVCEFVIRK